VEGIYGPVDKEACIVVQQQLARVVQGRDALAGELLWDVMYRSNRHARYGHYMMGIAAIDNALWDLRGKYFNAPVHRLLGGPSRDELECYASCLSYSFADEQLEARARQEVAQGFRHLKYFAAWGPKEGEEGLALNVDLVRRLREAVGPKVRLMIDAYSGWDLQYAMQWCRRVEQFEPWWLEEPFPAAHLESLEKLRALTRIPLATGEHIYNRWEAKRFLDTKALQFLQVDPEWCGGLSECVKIVAMASTQDTYVIAHGHNLHAAVHLAASQSPATCPLVECLVNKLGGYYYFDPAAPLPKNGRIAIPTAPGFGIEIDESRIEKRTLMQWA
jgi:L-alanine-DL-glutamate epimerase-like enolase superfamily enzyme